MKAWIDRYAAEGEAGLETRSSRPHTMPTRTSGEIEQKVLPARAEHRCGQDVLGPKVGVPPRTVARILRRHGVPYPQECDPMTGEVIRSSKTTAVRYERERPGELVHMDVKKLGRIPDGGGWRARGETRDSHQSRTDKTPIGYDYVHSLVDDHSRLAHSEILPDKKGETCAGPWPPSALPAGLHQQRRRAALAPWIEYYTLSAATAHSEASQRSAAL